MVPSFLCFRYFCREGLSHYSITLIIILFKAQLQQMFNATWLPQHHAIVNFCFFRINFDFLWNQTGDLIICIIGG